MQLARAIAVGLAAVLCQACLAECIYIYVKGHKACGLLQAPVLVMDGVGNEVPVTEADGSPPRGCACLPPELDPLVFNEPDNPAVDELHAAIENAARERCVELAMAMGADPAPCQVAELDESQVYRSNETFDECKYLGATIDEDKDGYCPEPPGSNGDEAGGGGPTDAGTDTGSDTGSETGTDTGSGGSPIIPDLPLEFP